MSKLRDHIARVLRRAPQGVDLHFDTDERLDDAIVQLARKAGALERADSRADAAEQIDAVKRGHELVREPLEETKLRQRHRSRVEQHDKARSNICKPNREADD